MIFKVASSGSEGNCYILEGEKESLVIELGIHHKNINKALSYNLNKVAGCLVTHSHGDHAKSIIHVLRSGMKVVCSQGTAEELGIEDHFGFVRVSNKRKVRVGGFEVVGFTTIHDTKEPLGFLIYHEEMGLTCFLTDSVYCHYNFPEVNHWIVEANYCPKILKQNHENGVIFGGLRDRIIKSHFSIESTKSMLKSNDLSKTQHIVLVHLSSKNSDADRFKKEVQEVTGIPTYIATKGLIIENFTSNQFQ